VPKNQSFSIQTIVNQFGVEKTIKINGVIPMKKQSLQQKALTHFAVKQRNNYYIKEYKLGSLRKKINRRKPYHNSTYSLQK
jgi:hypothetical protein